MSMQPEPLTEQQQQAVLRVCILAAFADGAQEEIERSEIQRIVQGFSQPGLNLPLAYQEVLSGKVSLSTLAGDLRSPPAAALAYEMAVCVCNADGISKEPEKKFLAQLHECLGLDCSVTQAHEQTAQALAIQPLASPVPPLLDSAREQEIDHLILNAAIMNGALEIMPHAIATMAIVPLQMRMVYQVGKRYGFDLDRGHITDFLGTVGIGLTSQVFEGFTRRLVGGLARGLAGGLLGGLAGQAAGSAFAFATTYALGQVAKRYYGSGRSLSPQQLKEVFSSMLQEARSMQGHYAGDIAQKSRQVNISELLPLEGQR